MRKNISQLHREKGAALMVALVILMLTMVVGVASLKQSVVQSKIATNTNASSIAFQAADTAVEDVMSEMSGDVVPPEGETTILEVLASASEARRCVVGEAVAGVCNPLQGPGQVLASSVTKRSEIPERPVTGSSTNTVVWRFYETEGTGRVGNMTQVSNEQEYVRRELAAASNTYDLSGPGGRSSSL